MTGGDGDNIRGDSKYGGREYRGWTICRDDLSDIHEYRYNEYDRVSTIYIYTDSTYSGGVRDECKYINRGDIIRDRELWGKLLRDDDARGKSNGISTITSDDRISVTISEGGVIRSSISGEYNGGAFIICDIRGICI